MTTLLRVTAHERVLVGTEAILHWVNRDQDGEPLDYGGAVTVAVTKADGSAVQSGSAAAGDETGEFTFTVTVGNNATLETWNVAWTRADGAVYNTTVRVVGGYHVSLTEARAIDPSLIGGIYDDATLLRARAQAEEEIKKMTNVDFVPTYHQVRISGNNGTELLLPDPYLRRVRTAASYGYIAGTTSWTYPSSAVQAIPPSDTGLATLIDGSYWEYGESNLVLEYEAGLDVAPFDVQMATVMIMRYRTNQTRNGRVMNAQPIQGPNGEQIQPASLYSVATQILRPYRMRWGI